MESGQLDVVTGAFGFSGKYIAQKLLDAGHRVRTLTNSVHRANPFEGRVEAHPYHWDDRDALARSLCGACVLYNTYWVRFRHGSFSHTEAVENTQRLFDAARRAGVERIVHTGISNPSEDSPLPYFSGKARLERVLCESGLSYAILRPAVLFGREGILVNNIAWMLRRFPVFGVFGDGRYKLQPIYVEDFAELAVHQGAARENSVIEAIGPETFEYRELVEQIGRIIGKRRRIVCVPPSIGVAAAKVMGAVLGDVVLTRDEVAGLMAGLLYTEAPPGGKTKLTDWVRDNASWLGTRYMSELARRQDRESAYEEL